MSVPSLPGGLVAGGGRPLGGGMICEVWRARLSDGREVVVKRAPYPVEVEADGLAALAEAGAPVPEVLAAEDDVLVLAAVGGPPDWPGLGAALARMHRSTGTAFGWHRDNLIGWLPQRNDPCPDWPDFYVNHRIRPWLGASALPVDVRRRLERACEGPLQALLDHDPEPSLVHGDLWSGNVVDGRWLVDPAVCYADREYELAFMDCFGGFPAALVDAYIAAWPLEPGWQARRPALQLYHLLVHVEHFGAGYVGGVTSRLDALGW
ncbi:MAG TPA: fructosamine kinase family protein [Egibacteraceae bacterium]|nr:fructosamine kinase family protein [Egibacteraceae bacterium]